MKKKKTKFLTQIALIAMSLMLSASSALAQNGPVGQSANNAPKTNSRMLYHNGPVLRGRLNLYYIFYGCWTGTCASSDDATIVQILNEFGATIGNTPYSNINSTYTDSAGQPASGAFVYAGEVFDNSYSHGVDLTESDIVAIIADQILNFALPQDPQGIYIVFASADVSSNATGFCIPGAPPFHSHAYVNGGVLPYVFIGNPNRCPSVAGRQFPRPTPNGSFAGDVMSANLMHALSGVVTNPFGNGWYDRYGLENADKCTGTFGQTYTTANGALANVRLSQRDFLFEQNWANSRRGGCVLFP